MVFNAERGAEFVEKPRSVGSINLQSNRITLIFLLLASPTKASKRVELQMPVIPWR